MTRTHSKPFYLAFIILCAILGASQHLPHFVHLGWPIVTFLPDAVVYGSIELFDYTMVRQLTYTIYFTAVILPLLFPPGPRQ